MIGILGQLFDSLLNGKNSNKNVAIIIIILMFIGLNLLGIDLQYLSNCTYSSIVINFIEIIILAVVSGAIIIKLNSINENNSYFFENNMLDEKIKEDIDLIESQIINLIDNQIQIINSCRILMEEINGIPNVKFLKMLFELKTNSMQYEIFKECITYTLTVNDVSQKIVLENLKNNIQEIQEDFSKFIRKNLKKYSINEELSDILNNVIFNNINIIAEELEREKKINEKMYVISIILKHMEEDIKKEVNEYLKTMQINLIQN